jgi:hypothetical protein
MDRISAFARHLGRALHRIVLVIMWLTTTASIAVMILQGVGYDDLFVPVRYALQVTYVSALLWFLSRTGSSTGRSPEATAPIATRRWPVKLVPVLGIALLLGLHVVSDLGASILPLLLIVATVLIIAIWRREISRRMVILGLGLASIALVAGIPLWRGGLVSKQAFVVFLAFAPPMFVAGGLLVRHTGLGGVQLLTGGYGKALKSFLLGCLLFVPLGLVNAIDDSPVSAVNSVGHWWMIFTRPWFSGIIEEVWFRLVLVGLCFFLLRPLFARHRGLAVLVAVVFSAVTFGLGHGRTLDKFLTTGLLYGLPMAVVFARRDWEHAVGAHYTINMIPMLVGYLEA